MRDDCDLGPLTMYGKRLPVCGSPLELIRHGALARWQTGKLESSFHDTCIIRHIRTRIRARRRGRVRARVGACTHVCLRGHACTRAYTRECARRDGAAMRVREVIAVIAHA